LAPPWCCLQQLAPDPGRGRAGGDVEMDQLTPLVPDDEENVDDAVVNGVDD
jgi:hypothetical protein